MTAILASVNSILEACMMILAAAVVVGFEMRRCSQGLAIQYTLKKYMPETIGLAVLALIAGVLRMKGPTEPPLDDAAWNEIVSQWPWLMTADTLLGFQSMLRFLLFNSALLRLGSKGCLSALSLEASAFFLAAMAVRVALFWYSPAYHLDGPVGGNISGGFELATLLPLSALVLSTGSWSLKSLMLIITGIAASAVAGSYHHFKLADDEVYANNGFVLIHCLETCAAIAHLFQAGSVALVSSGGIVALSLPVQQVLSAYYFLEAFEAVPALVGSGCPFELMWVTSNVQLGIYLFSGAVYLACLTEGMAARTPGPVAESSTAVSTADVPKLSTVVF